MEEQHKGAVLREVFLASMCEEVADSTAQGGGCRKEGCTLVGPVGPNEGRACAQKAF